MLRISEIQDIEILRQVAILQQRELDRAFMRLRELMTKLAQARGQDTSKIQVEIDILQDQIARQIENAQRPAPAPEKKEAKERQMQRGHGPREQLGLQIREEVHPLDESDRTCPVCQGVLDEMNGQFEEYEEVTVVERRFELVRHKRMKYRCRCNASVVTAPTPPRLIPGGRYSTEFAVEVAIAKYLDHEPLERQKRIMAREGLKIDSQTLWDQIEALAGHLEPSYRALRSRILESSLIHADETSWRLMGKGVEKKNWVWSITGPDAVFYQIMDSRSTEAAKVVLNGYRGTVMADGYTAYQALSRESGQFRMVHCWQHVRRKFEDIQENYPECREILKLIGELYAIERMVPQVDEIATSNFRAELREKYSAPIVKQIRDWVTTVRPLPQSELGKAVHYMLDLWPGLTAFLDEPRVPLDNNAAERGMRGVVVGRKNHYGSRSKRGTEVAALLYSLIETAKLCGVEPKTYLLIAARASIENPGSHTLPQSFLN